MLEGYSCESLHGWKITQNYAYSPFQFLIFYTFLHRPSSSSVPLILLPYLQNLMTIFLVHDISRYGKCTFKFHPRISQNSTWEFWQFQTSLPPPRTNPLNRTKLGRINFLSPPLLHPPDSKESPCHSWCSVRRPIRTYYFSPPKVQTPVENPLQVTCYKLTRKQECIFSLKINHFTPSIWKSFFLPRC